MTTQTPTSKLEGVDGVQGLAPAPAHLPDEAALGRWASALFAALPNQTPVLESPVLPSGDPKIGVPAHAPQPSDPTAALVENKLFLCKSTRLPTVRAAVTRGREQTQKNCFPLLPCSQSSSDKRLKLCALRTPREMVSCTTGFHQTYQTNSSITILW